MNVSNCKELRKKLLTLIADLKQTSRLNTNKESQKVFRSLDKKVQYKLISALVSAEDNVMITVERAKETQRSLYLIQAAITQKMLK